MNASARKASLENSARKVRCYLQLPGWISIYLHKIWPSIQGSPCPKSSLLLVYYRQRSQLSDIASVLQLTSFPIEIYQRLPLTSSFDAALYIPVGNGYSLSLQLIIVNYFKGVRRIRIEDLKKTPTLAACRRHHL